MKMRYFIIYTFGARGRRDCPSTSRSQCQEDVYVYVEADIFHRSLGKTITPHPTACSRRKWGFPIARRRPSHGGRGEHWGCHMIWPHPSFSVTWTFLFKLHWVGLFSLAIKSQLWSLTDYFKEVLAQMPSITSRISEIKEWI